MADVKALEKFNQSLLSEVVSTRAGLEEKISKLLHQQSELHSVQSKVDEEMAEQKVVLPIPPRLLTRDHASLLSLQDQEAEIAILQASIQTVEVEIAAAEKSIPFICSESDALLLISVHHCVY